MRRSRGPGRTFQAPSHGVEGGEGHEVVIAEPRHVNDVDEVRPSEINAVDELAEYQARRAE
jgi:hypothetical protein